MLFNPLLSGSNKLKGTKKIIIVKIAKGVLLLVSFINSDILMLINIRINKNNIETAPTQTNKQDIPMKLTPINIKQHDIDENNNIKYKTDIIGFLVIIINIPNNIGIIVKKNKNSVEYPYVIFFNKYKFDIKFK